MQLREELEVWKEHGPKQDRVRLPSFNEDSFVDSTSQDEVQYLKAIVSKLQQEKQQWSKNVNEQYLYIWVLVGQDLSFCDMLLSDHNFTSVRVLSNTASFMWGDWFRGMSLNGPLEITV